MLSRPTDTSITLTIRCREEQKILVRYKPTNSPAKEELLRSTLKPGILNIIELNKLLPNSTYSYEIFGATPDKTPQKINSGTFSTAKSAGTPFTFTLDADTHLDEGSSPDVLRTCLSNIAADHPDFHINLGDTFMTGKHPGRDSALKQYEAIRYYYSLIGNSTPTFFALGNHDGEEVKKTSEWMQDSLATWAAQKRTQYWLNPTLNHFYAANPKTDIPPYQNYYAWTWGDALFIILDPYSYSSSTRLGEFPWNMTLGPEQYQWLHKTLASSKSLYTFVFIHQLVSYGAASGRGGAEASFFHEWGGHESSGENSFRQNRKDWLKPIHDLLVQYHVTAVFHGHDHFYARQIRDGVTYQLAPQPSHRNSSREFAQEYGYEQGTFIPNSGHLRVHVTPVAGVTIEYIAAVAPRSSGKTARTNKEVLSVYAIPPPDPKKGASSK